MLVQRRGATDVPVGSLSMQLLRESAGGPLTVICRILIALGTFFDTPAMPTYDFECATCGKFDLMRRISERNDDALCPTCGRAANRVVVAGPSLAGGSSADDDSVGSYGMRHSGSCLCCK